MAGYGDDAGFAAWLSANEYDLPAQAPAEAALRQRGSVYVDGTYGRRFVGQPVGGYAQERAWPRTGAETGWGEAIPNTVIPNGVIEASYAAAYQEAVSPGSLSVLVNPSAAVKREKVGSLETEYFGPGDSGAQASTPLMTLIEGLLAPYLVCAQMPDVLVV